MILKNSMQYDVLHIKCVNHEQKSGVCKPLEVLFFLFRKVVFYRKPINFYRTLIGSSKITTSLKTEQLLDIELMCYKAVQKVIHGKFP